MKYDAVKKYRKLFLAFGAVVIISQPTHATNTDDEYRSCVLTRIVTLLGQPPACMIDHITKVLGEIPATYADCFTKANFSSDEIKEKSKINFDRELEIYVDKKVMACGYNGHVQIRDKGSFRTLDASLLDGPAANSPTLIAPNALTKDIK